MSTTISMKINQLREKRALCNRVKDMALSSNGIIFGGMVRDEIIGKHYRKQFIKKELDFDRYWDASYDPETKGRLIIPTDVDVFFKVDNNSASFINKLREFVKNYKGSIYIADDANFNVDNYGNGSNYLRHKLIEIEIRIGETLLLYGYKLRLKIDLIEINYSQASMSNIDFGAYVNRIEPPFYNLDFQCNIFIMERSRSKDDVIRVSNCTGTPMDDMIYSDKCMYSSQIVRDILNFTTKFARSVNNSKTEYVNCYRILKMIVRNVPWTITNLPFRFISIDEIDEDMTSERCCICLEDINDKETLTELNTNASKKNYLHKRCFIDYLTKEQRAKYHNAATNQIECRCPFRNFFKFRDCYKTIEYI